MVEDPFADKLEVTSTVFGVKADQTLLVALGRATGRESTAAFDALVQVGGIGLSPSSCTIWNDRNGHYFEVGKETGHERKTLH